MKVPDDKDDELKKIFAHLREAPPVADPARIAIGFETRVLARTRAAHSPDALRWFWRWSAVFSAAAIACVVLAIHNYNALNDDVFAALDSGISLLDWFY